MTTKRDVNYINKNKDSVSVEVSIESDPPGCWSHRHLLTVADTPNKRTYFLCHRNSVISRVNCVSLLPSTVIWAMAGGDSLYLQVLNLSQSVRNLPESCVVLFDAQAFGSAFVSSLNPPAPQLFFFSVCPLLQPRA